MPAKVRVSPLVASAANLHDLVGKFNCRRCGTCCTKFYGLILTESDIERLGVPEADRQTTFIRADGCWVLKQPCCYYNAELPGCNVYDRRPRICRDFPVHNIKCGDGRHHLGVAAECMAAIEALKQVEIEAGIRPAERREGTPDSR